MDDSTMKSTTAPMGDVAQSGATASTVTGDDAAATPLTEPMGVQTTPVVNDPPIAPVEPATDAGVAQEPMEPTVVTEEVPGKADDAPGEETPPAAPTV